MARVEEVVTQLEVCQAFEEAPCLSAAGAMRRFRRIFSFWMKILPYGQWTRTRSTQCWPGYTSSLPWKYGTPHWDHGLKFSDDPRLLMWIRGGSGKLEFRLIPVHGAIFFGNFSARALICGSSIAGMDWRKEFVLNEVQRFLDEGVLLRLRGSD